MWGGEVIVFERDKLYEQVWQEPVRTVAHSYGVSDVYLGRICRELGVPLPGRGYWRNAESVPITSKRPPRPAQRSS